MARSGSKYDDIRMIPARFAYVPQRSTYYLDMRFLLIFQEVEPISKTCNQLKDIMVEAFQVSHYQPLTILLPNP